jgi:hypothetical protein
MIEKPEEGSTIRVGTLPVEIGFRGSYAGL